MNLPATEDHTAPQTLQVFPWLDPVVEQVGYEPRSDYVETFWLPVLGPSSVLLLRQLSTYFEVAPEGFELDLDTCARSLGLGPGLGKWGPIQRTFSRCATFGMVRRWGQHQLLVRRALPPLTRHHVAHLPVPLQQRHAEWLAWALAQRRAQAPGGENALTNSVHSRTP